MIDTDETVHLDDARCADLALDLTPAPEREAALGHAARCPACEARLRAHVAAGERARADWRELGALGERVHRAGREAIAAHAAGGEPAGDAEAPAASAAPGSRRAAAAPVRPWRRVRFVTLAAAAALAVAVAIPMLRPRPAPAPWLPALGEEVRTRGDDAADPRLAAGLEAYRARDLATAERELAAARAAGSTERMRRIYLAHVRLERGDPRAALELLRGVEWREVPEPWRRQGVELLVRALRGSGQRTSADSIERALRALPPGAPFVP